VNINPAGAAPVQVPDASKLDHLAVRDSARLVINSDAYGARLARMNPNCGVDQDHQATLRLAVAFSRRLGTFVA
jgi:hypothetical protein